MLPWNGKKSKRFGPIIIVAEPGSVFQDIRNIRRLDQNQEIGLGGYDTSESMYGTFLAFGPSINPGVAISPLHSVDLLDLFCVMLDIPCPSNSGTDKRHIWKLFLKETLSHSLSV